MSQDFDVAAYGRRIIRKRGLDRFECAFSGCMNVIDGRLDLPPGGWLYI